MAKLSISVTVTNGNGSHYDRYEDAAHHMKWYEAGGDYIETEDEHGDVLDEGKLKTGISMYLLESVMNGQIEQAKDIKKRLQRLDLYDDAMQIIRENSGDLAAMNTIYNF